ncbi:Stk1 family PASTA domain-containing Ser/Thr kinase [Ornithinimicrobium sp. INDO-MA30-4]|uniref:Stk1 family PASTA domain-containing Ser/Thr kinase n=1 Tax=Ornithinimicrobium sp. INDO-MA30-4 TaxID=2908651 RepID=UPI001F1B86E8|nr:Stk1 family PASTA domain-containing Ser/Thr kinase [Ornithinimicrobium sp. INDO-MA30-4]UJH71300.1 Stk1 family PASTA domain-containing Ser/Thr kinase [Ornithinimicrobium sp. INDO-MA30-4]
MISASSDVIGSVLDDRYRIDAHLADGGMATVYQATDLRLHRKVALKLMRADLARDADFVSRFQREAQSAAKLSHPHVVSVYDQGEDGDHVFLVMELVDGMTLRDCMAARGPLTVRQATTIAEQILQALTSAHQAGLIHRDIKPENVLLTRNETVKVADFGLARAITASAMSRTSDLMWGTAAYLSPEQVEHGRADKRTDVYAVGLLLFEMLTGTKAFPGESPVQVAFAHVHGDVPQASAVTPTVPIDLDALIAMATATDPEGRPSDAGSLLLELRRRVGQLSNEELDEVPPGHRTADDATQLIHPITAGAAIPDATAPVHQPTTVVPTRSPSAPGHFARTSGNRKPPSGTSTVTTTTAPKPAPRRKRRGLLLAILLVVLGAGGAGATWFYTAGPGAFTMVPDVVGQDIDSATATLSDADLDAAQSLEYSETVALDSVMSMAPAPGESVRKGTNIDLVVSRGPERYVVPELSGLTVDQARTALTEANLTLGTPTDAFDPEVPTGQILSVDPAVGAEISPAVAVNVTVSAGPEPITIPSVVGSPQDEARQSLEGAGFTVEIADDTVRDNDVEEGSIASQSPDSGTGFADDVITLTVSEGPETVEVPDLIGAQYDEAKTQLEDLGFEVSRELLADGFFGTVRFQSIDAGEEVPFGTEIVLTVL